jgi:hypothetical protein
MSGHYLRTDNTTKRIVRVTFNREPDTDPDLSHLGEYSDRPAEVHIDRRERGDMEHGEYRYFNCGDGDPEYIEADYKRYEAYNRDEWGMLFCVAEAKISINGITQTLTSGGLAGVESDSEESYFREIEDEQLDELREVLQSCGFTTEQIDEAYGRREMRV